MSGGGMRDGMMKTDRDRDRDETGRRIFRRRKRLQKRWTGYGAFRRLNGRQTDGLGSLEAGGRDKRRDRSDISGIEGSGRVAKKRF
jgi:hypothetical protein